MLGTSPETPLGPGIRDIECVCEEIAHGRNTVSLAVNTSSVPCFSWHAALDSSPRHEVVQDSRIMHT